MTGIPSIEELGQERAYLDRVLSRLWPEYARRTAEEWTLFYSTLLDSSSQAVRGKVVYIWECIRDMNTSLVLDELQSIGRLERAIGAPVLLPLKGMAPSTN